MSKKEKEDKDKSAIEPRRAQRGVEPWYPEMLAPFGRMWEDFGRTFPREWRRPLMYPMMRRSGFTDLVDLGKEYEVRVEVPGIPRDKLNINVSENRIEISGRAEEERKEEEHGYVIRERGYSEVSRTLGFPEEVIPEKAEATLKGGVLQVRVPKKTPKEAPKRHRVEVKEE